MPSYPPPAPSDPRAREVLIHWFGDLPAVDTLPEGKMGLWFTKQAETDRDLRERFAGLRRAAIAGTLNDWLDSARGRLAAILLIDQFSRNLFRETPEAFAQDPLAREWCLEGLAQGMEQQLSHMERLFFCLPLEHAEELPRQLQFLDISEQFVREVPETLREWAGKVRTSAQAHHDIVARFGRFPHRNNALGRESTAEEIAFLQTPNSSF